MSREQKMLAVVEAARKLETAVSCKDRLLDRPQQALREALAALDAHTEAQEVVTLAVWEHAEGDLRLARIGSRADNWAAWTRLGTVTLPLTQEGGR